MNNPFITTEVKEVSSPLAETAKEYKRLPDRVLNSPIEGCESKNATSNEGKETGKQPEGNQENTDSPKRIKTINDGLAGQNHPETGVPYVEKEVTKDTGEKVIGVFPQFDSKFDVQLPEGLEKATDREQFNECNKQLKERCESDPNIRSQFNERQLDDINNGRTPYGYTWHHNEETGKMQLVDYETHEKTRHTGGKAIWGGGTENR